MTQNKVHSFIFFILAVLVLFISLFVAAWATSVGNNVTVTSALTVNGNSTFGDGGTDVNLFTGTLQASTTALFTSGLTTYGSSTFGDAAGDVNLFTGTLQASTTALFTSGLTTYGNSTFGDAGADVNLFTGTLRASTTALFTSGFTTYAASTLAGVNTFSDGLLSQASSTFSVGVLNVGSGSLGVATSSPGQELGVSGDAIFQGSSGTTTIIISSPGTNIGGCIEMKRADGTVFRLYLTTTATSAGSMLIAESGSCK